MKFDMTKLPVGEMIIAFLLAMLAVTFVGAFIAFEDEGKGEVVTEVSPTPAASPTPSETPTGAFAVSMGDSFFDPNEVTVAAGADVAFDISNDGVAIHNMRIAGADGQYNSDDDAVSDPQLMPGGGTGTLTWTAPEEAGTIDFRCDFHPQVMTGTITVE